MYVNTCPTDTNIETHTTINEEHITSQSKTIPKNEDNTRGNNNHSPDIRKHFIPVSLDVGRRQKSSMQNSSPIVVINQCIDSSSTEASTGKDHIVNNFIEDELFLSQPP